MKVSNRLARDSKEAMVEALAAYANMGDTPADWKKFRLMYPDFFPMVPGWKQKEGFQDLDTWMYDFAERWHRDFSDLPPDRLPLPPLLWYRNRLRTVWAKIDRRGYSLAVLLGFEDEAQRIGKEHPTEVIVEPRVQPSLVPGKSLVERFDVFPQGKPIISGFTGELRWEIRWEFGCLFQQALYELMLQPWRAKICPKCGRFFVALKSAQTFCSVSCSDDAKRERALNWWNEKGSKRRSKARAK
jgi:hypothetical protein